MAEKTQLPLTQNHLYLGLYRYTNYERRMLKD